VHLVGFIIRIYYDARSPERQIRSPVVYVLSLMVGSIEVKAVTSGFQEFCSYNPSRTRRFMIRRG